MAKSIGFLWNPLATCNGVPQSNAALEKISSQNAGDGKILQIIPKIPNYNSSKC